MLASTQLVSITIRGTLCSITIRQKSCTVPLMGPTCDTINAMIVLHSASHNRDASHKAKCRSYMVNFMGTKYMTKLYDTISIVVVLHGVYTVWVIHCTSLKACTVFLMGTLIWVLHSASHGA